MHQNKQVRVLNLSRENKYWNLHLTRDFFVNMWVIKKIVQFPKRCPSDVDSNLYRRHLREVCGSITFPMNNLAGSIYHDNILGNRTVNCSMAFDNKALYLQEPSDDATSHQAMGEVRKKHVPILAKQMCRSYSHAIPESDKIRITARHISPIQYYRADNRSIGSEPN